MEDMVGVTETYQLSKLQWQLMMSCWKISASIALQSWWDRLHGHWAHFSSGHFEGGGLMVPILPGPPCISPA